MSAAVRGVLIHILAIVFSSTTSTNTAAVSRDQTACTMCYSCDNPCQPQPLPPPPPPIPPPPRLPKCPPPPAEECSACAIPVPKYAPPPPLHAPYPNVSPGSGQFYAPPGPGYDNNPTPYFPNYNPPMLSSAFNPVHSKLQMTVFSIFLSLIALYGLCKS